MSSLTLPWRFGFATADEGVNLIGLPAERTAKRTLSGNADKALRTIASILNEMLVEVIAKRTTADFEEAVGSVFPRYSELVLAFGRILSAIVPREKLLRLSSESFAELEADIKQHGVASFGEHMTDRALFTVWTLRKTSELLQMLERDFEAAVEQKSGGVLKSAPDALLHALRARFHVDCLVTSMRTRQPLYPEVLPAIDDGLRSIVDAYAWVKRAVDGQHPQDETGLFAEYWTEDDEVLIDSSHRDLARRDLN